MPGVIDPTEYDERFPGGNYEDWIMNVVPPDELTARNIDQIIAIQRKLRAAIEGGVKMKKHEAPKLDLVKIGLKRPEPKLRIRRIDE